MTQIDPQAEIPIKSPASDMKVPTRARALRYLHEANAQNPGPWVEHSKHVALAAVKIAQHHPAMDPDLAYMVGLLHDIGRREGVFGMRHVYDGYVFLEQEGYPDAARFCVTHSYPIPNVAYGATAWDGTLAQRNFVQNVLDSIEYTPYDHLIQFCDSICLPSGPVLMEKRLVDVALRYGFNQYTLKKWRALFRIQREFETVIGKSIYGLLPGVMDNTFTSSF
jgi:hypothetical protein